MIKLDNVTKSFSGKEILNGFSLTVEYGSKIAFFGASGCGKTTLLRIIAGLEKADGGSVICNEKLSFVFQEDRLFEDFTVLENIAAVCNEEKANEILDVVGLSDDKDKMPAKLSGGMSRRAAIARALAFAHSALILDEPFSGIDNETKDKIIDYIENNENGTVILVSHDISECDRLCDRTVYI